MDYNYETFDGYIASGKEVEEFTSFKDRLHVGERAPDGAVLRLGDSSEVQLSTLWATRGIVLEFGSFT